jgi:acylphosphatase
MKNNVKNVYAVITNHIQMAGYRDLVEGHAKIRGLSGFVFNDIDGSVRLMASGPEIALIGFLDDLKAQRPDTIINSIDISEDISLPSPFGRIAVDEMRDICERLDQGNIILSQMNTKLGGMDNKLDGIDTKLSDISNKLDTLPEKIAQAIN